MSRLEFVYDPQRPPFELTPGEKTLGRRPTNDYQLNHETVSGNHVSLDVAEDRITIRDLKSTNGTYVNGQQIFDPVDLKHGDLIKVGEAHLRLDAPALQSGRGRGNPLLAESRASASESEAFDVMTDDDATITGMLDCSRDRMGALSTNAEAKLRAVLDISQRLSGAHGLSEVLPAILDSLFGIFPLADRGCILLKQEESGEMVARAMKHRNPEEDATIRLSRTITRQVLETKQGVMSADAAKDANFSGGDSIVDLKIHSMMCVPMLSQDNEPVGMISIDTQSLAGRFQEADLDLLISVAGQAAQAYENARLLDSYLQKQKQDNEMTIAHGVQKALLPQSLPQTEGYEFYASYDAAQAVGGDYYDAMNLPGGKICFSFGDVAGKGVPGALIMSRMNSCVRSTMKHVYDVETAINAINDHMCESAVEGRFVTYVLAILDPATGEICLSNAGHMPPVIRRANGELETFDDDDLVGPPIGVVDGYPYDVECKTLEKGDLMVIVTDGVDEAMDPNDNFYTAERMLDFVKNGPASAEEMATALLADVRRHANGRAQNDDITIMVLGRKT
jgi:sigma-B regulation protein RsbU (phosphoserine phosphatase)